jgi:hypothetical protein
MGLWAALALFVVTLRAFVPAGLMLDHTGPDGQLSIVICTAQGIQPAHPDDDGTAGHHNGDPGCLFAVTAHAVFPVLPLAPPVRAMAIPVYHPLSQAPVLAVLTAPPLPARGPPLSA